MDGGDLRERLARLGSRRRGVLQESEAVRSEIVDLVLEVQGGAGGVTMGEAAELVGLTRQGLYALLGARAA